MREASARSISVIIPTWNERNLLPAAIASIGVERDVEILVVDGGSDDGTREMAERLADRSLVAKRGRAIQMNAAAEAASGELLVFLHADTRLPPNAMSAIREALASPAVVGGAFRIAIDSSKASLRGIASLVNLRSETLGLPFGDQGIFVKKSHFLAMGGYRDLPIMEDLDFIRRLRRRGPLHIIKDQAMTSDRRWRRNGVLRTTIVNSLARLMYRCGISPKRIRTFYDSRLGQKLDAGSAAAKPQDLLSQ